jgi:hypothetical protein
MLGGGEGSAQGVDLGEAEGSPSEGFFGGFGRSEGEALFIAEEGEGSAVGGEQPFDEALEAEVERFFL